MLALQNIPAVGADRDGLDALMRENVSENIFQLKLHYFPAGLRGSLFGPSFEVINLGAQVLDESVPVGFFQTMLLIRLLPCLLTTGAGSLVLKLPPGPVGKFDLETGLGSI